MTQKQSFGIYEEWEYLHRPGQVTHGNFMTRITLTKYNVSHSKRHLVNKREQHASWSRLNTLTLNLSKIKMPTNLTKV